MTSGVPALISSRLADCVAGRLRAVGVVGAFVGATAIHGADIGRASAGASRAVHGQPSRATADHRSPTTPAPPLDSTTKFALTNVQLKWVDYRGRRALNLAPLPGHEKAMNEEMSAVLTESDFRDGTIELDVAGARRAGYSKAEDLSGFKGMIGVSFRVEGERAERFYIRPENSRLDNQLFRNRSTQYESMPGYPWDELRESHPGEYESYVDLESGAWTAIKVTVSGTTARLYVNGAAQPALVVTDLKQGPGHGKIALWTRVSTDAYFSNLRVRDAR